MATTLGTKLGTMLGTELADLVDPGTLLYGAETLNDTNYYDSATGGAGAPGGFWGTLVFTPTATGASATRILLSALLTTPTRGYDIRTGGANATISMIFVDGTGTGRASGTGILGAAAVGKTHVFSFGWDPANSKLRTYLNRAEIGSGTNITGHNAGTGPVRIGRSASAAGGPATNIRDYGFILGTGIPTLDQVMDQHAAIRDAGGRIRPMLGMTATMLVDASLDAIGNGGALGATLLDRVGSNHMARVGSPTTGSTATPIFTF